jgi:hypothetical protein
MLQSSNYDGCCYHEILRYIIFVGEIVQQKNYDTMYEKSVFPVLSMCVIYIAFHVHRIFE